jgi:hypothetical protein
MSGVRDKTEVDLVSSNGRFAVDIAFILIRAGIVYVPFRLRLID